MEYFGFYLILNFIIYNIKSKITNGFFGQITDPILPTWNQLNLQIGWTITVKRVGSFWFWSLLFRCWGIRKKFGVSITISSASESILPNKCSFKYLPLLIQKLVKNTKIKRIILFWNPLWKPINSHWHNANSPKVVTNSSQQVTTVHAKYSTLRLRLCFQLCRAIGMPFSV